MPYKRRYSKTNKRRWRRRTDKASLALARIRSLSKRIRPEYKLFDSGTGGSNPSNNGLIYPISLMDAGLNDAQRTGWTITARGLYLRYNIAQIAGVTTRVMVVRDSDGDNTGGPTITEILEQVGNVNATNSPLNSLFMQRFRILWDRCYSVETHYSIKKYIRMNSQIKYLANTGSTAAWKGNLYLVLISNNSSASNSTVDWTTRLRYTDS